MLLAPAFAVLAFGAQDPRVLLVLALWLVGTATLAALELERIPPLAWLAFGLAAYTAIQALPLPNGWIAALSPEAFQVWTSSLELLPSSSGSSLALSLEPGASAVEALKWLMYGAAYVACAAIRVRRGADWLASIVFAVALSACIVTLVHGLLEAKSIYGLYQPSFGPQRWTRGPVLNANHLAGLLNLGVFAGLALLLTGRGRVPVLALKLGLLLLLTGSLLAASRAGTASLMLGLVAVAAIALRSRLGVLSRGTILIATAIAIALLAGGSALLASLGDGRLADKPKLWSWSLRLIPDFPWFGVGRGAFQSAFPPYRGLLERNWTTVFSHPENVAVQWLAEWGIPVTAIACVVGAVLLVPVFRRARQDPLASVLLTGLSVLLLHNLADFSLELPAIGLCAVFVLSACDLRRQPRGGFGQVAVPGRSWVGTLIRTRPALALAGLAAVLLLDAREGFRTARRDQRAVSDAYQGLLKSSAQRVGFWQMLHSAVRRHPGDPYFAVIGALAAARTKDDSGLRWAGRALERGPVNGTSHIAAATVLNGRGRTEQALMHLRLAATYDVVLQGTALKLAASWADTAARLAAAFPAALPGSELLLQACRESRIEIRLECLELVLRRKSQPEVAWELADLVWRALVNEQQPCSGAGEQRCLGQLHDCARTLRDRGPAWRRAVVEGRILGQAGDHARGVGLILDACAQDEGRVPCTAAALDLSTRGPSPFDLLRRAADAHVRASCPTQPQCTAAHDAAAAAFGRRKAWANALEHQRAATNGLPDFAHWSAMAEIALEGGFPNIAQRALERARLLVNRSSQPELKRLAALEQRLLSAATRSDVLQ